MGSRRITGQRLDELYRLWTVSITWDETTYHDWWRSLAAAEQKRVASWDRELAAGKRKIDRELLNRLMNEKNSRTDGVREPLAETDRIC